MATHVVTTSDIILTMEAFFIAERFEFVGLGEKDLRMGRFGGETGILASKDKEKPGKK